MHFKTVVRTGLWGRVVTPQQPDARKELSQKGHFVPSYLMERVGEEEMKKQTENGNTEKTRLDQLNKKEKKTIPKRQYLHRAHSLKIQLHNPTI
jgi:hypothetical protein